MTTVGSRTLFAPNPPVVILGVPFDVVTRAEAVRLVEEMILSRQPHYIVTPNVDFLVQAAEDLELRRILFEAHLVVCDGTPLVWASRWLGNPLPERVAGSDLVPLLLQLAAHRGYRVFFLGASETSLTKAIPKLRDQYPGLKIAGSYSPPYNQLLAIDHECIKARIVEASPDLLLVCLGCPKQEKWMAMHYRGLGVPVTAGVGGTIDFLAGQVKRAPRWIQKAGLEWLFRLSQEPRRLFRRYTKDLWVFGRAILAQWWRMKPARKLRSGSEPSGIAEFVPPLAKTAVCQVTLPARLDAAAVTSECPGPPRQLMTAQRFYFEASSVEFVDSTGVGWLIHWQKRLRAAESFLVLIAPSPALRRGLTLLRLDGFFLVADSLADAERVVLNQLGATPVRLLTKPAEREICEIALAWQGDITAANTGEVWEQTRKHLCAATSARWRIDLAHVPFMDSSGLGLLIRLKKLAQAEGRSLALVGMQPAVRNVVQMARLTEFFAETICQGA
ncbi:MAG TPA: WecB/TagA/CpsF family glycosyltransferase [Verrucomicrobiae bacterium]|nr:WecB/TagA/CpsF family glycosyltransferase [Verrucomicrobiae bacterium]